MVSGAKKKARVKRRVGWETDAHPEVIKESDGCNLK